MNAPRAGRGAKDRQSTAAATKLPNLINQGNKSPSQVSITVSSPPSYESSEKSSETFNPKIQPTAEQMRIAQIINDGNKNDDPDIQNKIEQVMELTKKSRDEVQIALHDCDNDPERAALLLLEGIQDHEGKWELSVKKKKNRQPGASMRPSEETNGVDGPNNNKEESSKSDGRKSRGGPPRMNHRNWRNKENEKNERNATEEGSSRGGDKESRSRGRKSGGRGSRSRGGETGNRNSTGSGGRSRTFQNKSLNNTASSNFPPSIEMWSNTAATETQPSTTLNVGNWSDFTASEDWGEDDWSGNLETTVYTPSSSTVSPHTDGMVPPAPPQDSSSATSTNHYNGGPPPSYSSYSTAVAADLQDKSDRQPKVQRVRMPPPSKIPETAVEMPGDSVGGLEIQFGGLQFTGSLDFTATSSVVEAAPVVSFPVSTPLPSIALSSSSSSYSTGGMGTSLYPAVTSSSTHPSILNKQEPLLLPNNTTYPTAATVPRPMAISPLDGTTKSTSDISSFYSASQKAHHPPPAASYSSSPLYPASSSTSPVVSNNYQQPSSTSGAPGFGSAAAYGSSAATAAEYPVYSNNTSQAVSSKLPEQQSMGPQGTYGNNEPLGPPQLGSNSAAVMKTSMPTASQQQQQQTSAANKGYNPLPPTLLPPQYIMGQAPPPNLSFYQQPVCNYEDIQSRLATLGYYDVPVAAAPGRDNMQYTTSGGSGGNVPTSGEAPKYPAPPNRGSAGDGGEQPTSSSSSSQQTSFPIPPGYGYYIHGGMMTPSHYPTPFFSVHQPSNAHGVSTTTTQFQKPTAAAFGSHSFNSVSYDSLNAQSQDFLKGSSFAPSSQGKTGSDLTAGAAMYNKGNPMLAKTFEKAAAGFQNNPHQYGMATAGNQTSFGFISVLPQHHSLMHLRQDGGAPPSSSASQQKAKQQGYAATTYWNT